MPYTKQEDRSPLDPLVDAVHAGIKAAGDLTYCITRLAHLRTRALLMDTQDLRTKYERISSVQGILNDARDDYHDNVMNPYEKVKRHVNGDIGILIEEFDIIHQAGKK